MKQTQRTRNRIREHSAAGHAFTPTTQTMQIRGLGLCRLFECLSETCSWIGWIPEQEWENQAKGSM